MSEYILMHKNQGCGAVEIDDADGKLARWASFDTGLAPFLGNATLRA